MRRRGFTLIEIMIALGIAALATATAVASINSLTDADLRSSAIALSGAIKMSYDRSIMQKRTQRLALDLDKGMWWIEYSEAPFALSKERERGERGERPDGEEAGEKLKKDKKRFDWFEEQKTEVERIIEGEPAPFGPDLELDDGKPQPLPSGVHFARVWTGHQEDWFSGGMAYLHFFKTGFTEPAIIELMDDGEDVISLQIQPLTGRVSSHHERLSLPRIEEDNGRKDGDE